VTKEEIFGYNTQRYIWIKLKTAYQHKSLISNTVVEVWRAPYGHWIKHELICIPKYYRVKCEVICRTAKAWLKTQLISNCTIKMAEKKRKESRCYKEMLHWNLKKAVHKQISAKLNKIKQLCEEQWAEIPPQWCERMMTPYRQYHCWQRWFC